MIAGSGIHSWWTFLAATGPSPLSRQQWYHRRLGPRRRAAGGTTDMALATYAVVRDGNFWTIKYDKQNYGKYKTQQEAVTNAIKTAHKIGEKGHEARVLIQGIDNRLHVEWVYGKSPDPPPD